MELRIDPHGQVVCVYGEERDLRVVSYEAVWPRVLGLRTPAPCS